ncbi:MAG: Gfo/Idh/MocA family oxidoreductase [Gracilibacteraceae bacterium]|jgi:predicted dehydrogenase|nr:Gfo/Idh/MocA family oxidoreductase [Gracilibacteraceae bacterium]
MNRKKLGFGVIGCGRISAKHFEAIAALPTAELAAVCDVVLERADRAAVTHGARGYYTYPELLKRADVDIVTIATPSGSHAEIAVAAAQAGKHVLVEKPMAMRAEDLDRMIEACRRAGVKLGVIHQNRFNPAVRALRAALEAGRFGRLTHAQATVRWHRDEAYYAQAPWRGTKEQDGGVLMNQSIHNIDLLQWMLGGVESVFGYTATALRPIEMEDVAVAVLRGAGGALGVIEAATTIYPRNLEETLNVFGATGSAVIGGLAINRVETWDFADGAAEREAMLAAREADPPDVYGFGHTALFADMIEAVLEDRPPAVPGEEGRKAVEIVLGIYRSVAEGRPVPLSGGVK